jgi:hypothetical protein
MRSIFSSKSSTLSRYAIPGAIVATGLVLDIAAKILLHTTGTQMAAFTRVALPIASLAILSGARKQLKNIESNNIQLRKENAASQEFLNNLKQEVQNLNLHY